MTRMVLLLCHSEVIGRRTCPTCERDDQLAEDQNLRRGFSRDHRALRLVPSAGLPLSARGSARFSASAHTIQESRLYGEAPSGIDFGGPSARQGKGLFDQSLGGAGVALGLGTVATPWLSPSANTSYVANFTICRIVMCHKSFHRLTGYWSPRAGSHGRNRWP